MTIKAYYQDNFATQYNGHVLNILPQLKPESIQCCVTSPPYWGLRDYGLPPQIWDDPGGCEHEWGDESIVSAGRNDSGEVRPGFHGQKAGYGGERKASQGQFCQLCGAWRGSLGLEPDPSLYIQHIVQIFREVKRVLRKDGTLWLNMGDSYASSPKGNKTESGLQSKNYGIGKDVPMKKNIDWKDCGLKPKDLCGIPWRVALALQADGWWLRSDIIWSKPNPMPESVTDRPTRAHEYVFLLTKSGKYFYDADAVREPHQESSIKRDKAGYKTAFKGRHTMPGENRPHSTDHNGFNNPAGRNLRSVWTIATEPTPEAHFATFPEKLVIPCIKAGTSEKGCCPECGAPWMRVVEQSRTFESGSGKSGNSIKGKQQPVQGSGYGDVRLGPCIKSKTIGWKPSCECIGLKKGYDWMSEFLQPPIPCTVCDPFSGSGKVLTVAKKLFRKAIGIELNADYCEMPVKKLAPGRFDFK